MTYSDQTKQYVNELLNLNKKDLVAFSYEKLTVDGTVKTLASIPTEARYALIQVESSIATAAIRYKESGTPSSTDGFFKYNSEAFDVVGYQNLINFKTTQVSAGTHYLHVQYYK